MESVENLNLELLSLKKLNSYKVIQTLKNDPKGNVYKCLNMQKWSNIHWCVLKQGIAQMCKDDSGRTIHDRLSWQNEVLRDLKHLSILPEALDHFEVNNISWLAMEYVSGQSLKDKVSAVYKGVCWRDLKQKDQEKIVDYMDQILILVSVFHAQGY